MPHSNCRRAARKRFGRCEIDLESRRLFEAGNGKLDTTWVAEDLGSQTGPLISLQMYRRFLLPNQVRMADLGRLASSVEREGIILQCFMEAVSRALAAVFFVAALAFVYRSFYGMRIAEGGQPHHVSVRH